MIATSLSIGGYSSEGAVAYQSGQFPPSELDYRRLIGLVRAASQALGKYDQLLDAMPNSDLLLAPLRKQEAIASSRMEGTVSTLDEIIQLEAEYDELLEAGDSLAFNNALETLLYSKAMSHIEGALLDGYPLSSQLMRQAHEVLLSYGRGAQKSPGRYKQEQNYIVDRREQQILFIPIAPEYLAAAMEDMVGYLNEGSDDALLRVAICHLEFEALHPFLDGNGRVGRMFITLSLWKLGLLSAPRFYISRYFEDHKDEYIASMRAVSERGQWTRWVEFFLNAVIWQAEENIRLSGRIFDLYDRLKIEITALRNSGHMITVLDNIFEQPIFTVPRLHRTIKASLNTTISKPALFQIISKLEESGIVTCVRRGSGRRAALYRFDQLMDVLEI